MSDWKPWLAVWPVTTIDCERIVRRPVWWRRVGWFRYKYKAMTPAEEADYVSAEAWPCTPTTLKVDR